MRPLVGCRFGRLVVVGVAPQRHRQDRWLCRCDCGGEKIVSTSHLGATTLSCGCLRKEIAARKATKHGAATGKFAPEYRPWLNMKTRCRYENRRDYKNYGARGITVYEPWQRDFAAFRAYIGPRPTRQHSIERIDNDGNYEPGNVRWATTSEQNKNKRRR